MKKNKKINFAIVGCGHIGTRHAEHIFDNKQANLVALCDIKINRAKKLGKKYNCPLMVKDYKKLLKNNNIDVVNVCVPNYLHAPITIAFLKNNKNVLCEKPMCLKISNGEKMIEWAKKKNKKLFIVKQNRYNPPVEVTKNILDKKALGKIYLCITNLFWNRNDDYYKQSEWRGTKKMDGGTLFTQYSHFIDLLLWFNGSIESVFAQIKNYTHKKIEFEDTGIVLIKFKNGSMGTINFTTCSYNKNMEGSIYLLGTKGSIKIGGEYLNTLDYWNVAGTKRPRLERGAPANNYGFYKGSMSNHDKVIQNVINVLNENGKIKATGQEGLETTKVINAIYNSARLNKKIYL